MLTLVGTSADYAESVRRFSVLKTGVGSAHGQLATFLSPLLLSRHRPTLQNIVPSQPFLAFYDFVQDADARSTGDRQSQTTTSQADSASVLAIRGPTHIDSPEDIVTCSASSSRSSSGRVFFLRGYPSARWLGSLGSCHFVDPEFFKRWLEFPYAPNPNNQFSTPSLPTSCWNLLELPIVSIGRRSGARVFRSQHMLESARSRLDDAIRAYQTELLMGTYPGVGSSVARDISLFDDTHFAIEQRITICMQSQEGSNDWVRECLLNIDTLC